jgi:hypothetical protein
MFPNRGRRDGLDEAQRTLATIGIVCLVILTSLVLWAGVGILLTMDKSSASQGGRFYVGVGLLVALVWLVSQFSKLAKRFRR